MEKLSLALAALKRQTLAPMAEPQATQVNEQAPLFGEPDESKLNAPDRQTLFMLWAISLATLVMWGAGRAACNYHVDGEGLRPRATTSVDRSKSAKGAAFEWAQALEAGRFADAKRLSAPAALASVKQAEASCTDCPRAEIESVATVIRQTPKSARIKVETWVHGSPKRRTLDLEKTDIWRVVSVE